MYLMTAPCPDLAFTVGRLARYVENPGSAHWNALKRVLRYVMSTRNLALVYGGYESNITLGVCVDAD